MSEVIPGLTLVYATGGSRQPEDPEAPYRLEVQLSTPQFMEVTYLLLYGSGEKLVVQGRTLEGLQRFIELNELRTHPRLRELRLSGPDGVIEQQTGPRRD